VDVQRRGGGESLEGVGRNVIKCGGLDAGGDTGWVGCGVCWDIQSSRPANHSGTAGCSEPSLARALSLTCVRTWVSVLLWRRGVHMCTGVRGEADERRVLEGGMFGPERMLVRADWRASGGWRREELTAMLACAAGRRDAAPLCLPKGPLGGGRNTADEGRRRAGKG
jgi:hypothetical protein